MLTPVTDAGVMAKLPPGSTILTRQGVLFTGLTMVEDYRYGWAGYVADPPMVVLDSYVAGRHWVSDVCCPALRGRGPYGEDAGVREPYTIAVATSGYDFLGFTPICYVRAIGDDRGIYTPTRRLLDGSLDSVDLPNSIHC
jgi:hypothetical protein